MENEKLDQILDNTESIKSKVLDDIAKTEKQAERSRENNKKYQKDYKTIQLKYKKTEVETIDNFAIKQGFKSTPSYIKDLIEKDMKKNQKPMTLWERIIFLFNGKYPC